jgi:hypothetical protein
VATQAYSQVLINEFLPETGQVELVNLGGAMQDVSTLVLCSFPTYNVLSSLTLESGSLLLAPGELVVVSGHNMSQADDELGLYTASEFTNPAAMEDYVEWGSTGHQRSIVAQNAGIWAANDFVASPPAGSSLAWDGSSDASSAWHDLADPNLGSDNFPTSISKENVVASSVWPVPTTDILHINTAEGLRYQLYDLVGNIVLSGVADSNENTLDVSALQNGYYVLKLHDTSIRVIKN